MPVKGTAGIMLADARAAVRNSASRRVIDPVICVLKMRALPRCYHRSTAQRPSMDLPTCPVVGSTVGWEPRTHPLSIERINLFAREDSVFVAGFVFKARQPRGCTSCGAIPASCSARYARVYGIASFLSHTSTFSNHTASQSVSKCSKNHSPPLRRLWIN